MRDSAGISDLSPECQAKKLDRNTQARSQSGIQKAGQAAFKEMMASRG